MLKKKRDRELSRQAAMDAAEKVYLLMLLLADEDELALVFREAHRSFSKDMHATLQMPQLRDRARNAMFHTNGLIH